MLPDPWTANAPAQAENRAGALAPIAQVLPTALIYAAVEIIDMKAVRPPVFGDLKRWRDLVPADRLRAAEAP